MTHCSPVAETPRSAPIAGSAIATIVTSRTTTNCATHSRARRGTLPRHSPYMLVTRLPRRVTGKLGFGGNARTIENIELLGDDLALDFANTLEATHAGEPHRGPPAHYRGPRHLGAPRRRAARPRRAAARRPRRGARAAGRDPRRLHRGRDRRARRPAGAARRAARRARRRGPRGRLTPGDPGRGTGSSRTARCGRSRSPPSTSCAPGAARAAEALRQLQLAVPRPHPQRLAALVLDGRVRRPDEDAPLPRRAARG